MKDDGGSNIPGTVRRSPSGTMIAVRIADPAAWVVVNLANGKADIHKIASYFAGDIYEWPVITHGRWNF